jgi:hypothetical protein
MAAAAPRMPVGLATLTEKEAENVTDCRKTSL